MGPLTTPGSPLNVLSMLTASQALKTRCLTSSHTTTPPSTSRPVTDRVSPGLLQALWLCPNDSGHGWARPPPPRAGKGCEAGPMIYITYLWHFGCPLELARSHPEQTRGDSFCSPTDTIQVRPARSTLTMRVFSFFELCKEKLTVSNTPRNTTLLKHI